MVEPAQLRVRDDIGTSWSIIDEATKSVRGLPQQCLAYSSVVDGSRRPPQPLSPGSHQARSDCASGCRADTAIHISLQSIGPVVLSFDLATRPLRRQSVPNSTKSFCSPRATTLRVAARPQ
jgi:hypothetical protein